LKKTTDFNYLEKSVTMTRVDRNCMTTQFNG
jgi:hypothetical protein